jgi:hypothetical protein
MYEYQAQTSLPPIRARQQRPTGVQVQQLYETSPVIATLAHHPSTNHYNSNKLPPAESSAIVNGNASTLNSNNTSNGTANTYQNYAHHQNSTGPSMAQTYAAEPTLRNSPSADSMLSMRSSSQPKRTNALDPETAMKTYMSKLTAYERHEIFSYPQIFFVGQNARKRQGVGGGPNNGKETWA